MNGSDPDAPLLRDVAQGKPAAVQALVAGKLPWVHSLAARMLRDVAEAEDVAQEALVRAWRYAPRWQEHGTARFDTWLHTVVLNLCRDRLRRRREQPSPALAEQIDATPLADLRIEAEQTSRRVRNAIAELPPRQRDAILLHHYQEMSNTEAAKALGVSVEALESLLSRGRRSLRVLLKGVDP